jgi:hypothetical protein
MLKMEMLFAEPQDKTNMESGKLERHPVMAAQFGNI